ncbi:MAG: hypothetical protein HZB92_03790 [Euryarchaeota archaeon]|nr:hypothetical protein [Euryarchaeota archaeon]
MRMEFGYNRSRLWGSLFLGLAMSFGAFLLLFGLMSVDIYWSLGVWGLFSLFALVSLASPLMTSHALTGDALHIRYGVVLRTTIPVSNIASVEPTERRPLMEGVSFSVMGGAIYVTTEPRNLVAIRLKEGQRFPAALWKSADTIILSVSEPDRLVYELRKLLA